MSEKPCYSYYSPFVYYRRRHRIDPLPDTQGTLAFAPHTTPNAHHEIDYPRYIAQLKALPEEYQPVSVCLHMHDIVKGYHRAFIESGFPTYTAGHAHDHRFAERFYDMLRQFRYTTAVEIGSHTFYSVEMGIPFFVYGDRYCRVNLGDDNARLGTFDDYAEDPIYRKYYDLFNHFPNVSISTEQQSVASSLLGLDSGLGRLEMCKILYCSLVRWLRVDTNCYVLCRAIMRNLLKTIRALFEEKSHA
tara:strand:+ start:691 stop:1428 length:738 start_codon:yes stop_codon:yes gene_type:complete